MDDWSSGSVTWRSGGEDRVAWWRRRRRWRGKIRNGEKTLGPQLVTSHTRKPHPLSSSTRAGPQLQAAKLVEATTPDQRRQTRQVQSTIPNAIVPWPSLRPVSASFAQVVVGNALDQSICHVGSRLFSSINRIVDGFEDPARLEGAQTKDISKFTNNQCQHIYYQNQESTDMPPLNPHCLGVPSRWTLH